MPQAQILLKFRREMVLQHNNHNMNTKKIKNTTNFNLNEITIGIINIRGINCTEKILYLFDIIKNNRIKILFIQETHLVDIKILKKIEETFIGYKTFFALCNNKTKGVCFIILDELNCCNTRVETPDLQRIMIVSLMINNTEISFVNIYVPNDSKEQITFINKLYDTLFYRKNIILGGDFNFVENNKLERTPSHNEKII